MMKITPKQQIENSIQVRATKPTQSDFMPQLILLNVNEYQVCITNVLKK